MAFDWLVVHYALFFTYGVIVSCMIYVYSCADASNSRSLNGRATIFLTRTLPEVTARWFKNVFGTQIFGYLERLHKYVVQERNPILQIAYLVIINGGFIGWLFFGEPLLPTYLVRMPPYSKSEAYIGVFLCHYTWFLANWYPPGEITAENYRCYDHTACDEVLFSRESFCPTCQVHKPARSKHCSLCGVCVPSFDHHCIWLNQCVGEHNYRFFLLFLVTNSAYLLYFAHVIGLMLLSPVYEHNLLAATFVNSNTGQEFKASWLLVARYVLNAHLVLFIVFMLSLAFGLTLLLFLLYHLSLVWRGTTTNETYKWATIRRIHGLLLRSHGRFLALQRGEEYEEPKTRMQRLRAWLGAAVGRLLGAGRGDATPAPAPGAGAAASEGGGETSPGKGKGKGKSKGKGKGKGGSIPAVQPVATDRADEQQVGCAPPMGSAEPGPAPPAMPEEQAQGQGPPVEGQQQQQEQQEQQEQQPERMDVRDFPGSLHPVRWVIEHSGVPDLLPSHPGPLPDNPYRVGLLRALWFIAFPKSAAALAELHHKRD